MAVKVMKARDAVNGLLQETIQHEIASRLLDKWVPVQLWYTACNTILPTSAYEAFLEERKFSEGLLSTCLTNYIAYSGIIGSYDPKVNSTGIYRMKYKKKYFLYITKQSEKELLPAAQPSVDVEFWAQVETTQKQFERNLRRFGEGLDNMQPEPPSRNIRRRLNEASPQEDEVLVPAVVPEQVMVHQSATTEEEELLNPYWVSVDAQKLFGSRPDDENAYVTLQRRIQKLQGVNSDSLHGYKVVIQGGDPRNECTPTDIHNIKQRALILLLVYKRCLKEMGTKPHATFEACIQQELQYLQESGVDQATYYRTVQANRSCGRTLVDPEQETDLIQHSLKFILRQRNTS